MPDTVYFQHRKFATNKKDRKGKGMIVFSPPRVKQGEN
jgi:hypothetical protein